MIDVARQEDYKMLMREWTEYYASPNRHKILNVISLEFTNTRLVGLHVVKVRASKAYMSSKLWLVRAYMSSKLGLVRAYMSSKLWLVGLHVIKVRASKGLHVFKVMASKGLHVIKVRASKGLHVIKVMVSWLTRHQS